jgi:CARDB
LTITASGKQSNPTRITVTMLLIVVETASPHDVAVNYVKPSLTSATIGSTVNITITVINNGKLPENVTIQAIVADQTVGMMNVTNLAPGQNVTVTIPWNTSGYSSGAYMVGGKVQGVKGETNLSDNLLRYAIPVTLNAANTSILNNAYTIPLIIIAAIIIAAIAMGLFLLPRRRPIPVK